MKLKRVSGGHTEVLVLPNGHGLATVLGKEFDVDEKFGKALWEDGTKRFMKVPGGLYEPTAPASEKKEA